MHFEDRHDPWDMSMWHVRPEVVDGLLIMEVIVHEGLPDLDDADLSADAPIEVDSSKRDVEAQEGNKPGDWVKSIFSRRP
ncbi:MAG: hypothetical protein ACKV0T_04755 [Planctomycetales bacterium]